MEKTRPQEVYCYERNYIIKIVDVIEYLIDFKRELYTLRHLRERYANIKGVGVNSIQNINIKTLIERRLEGKVPCCMPKSAKSIEYEYLISVEANMLPGAINAIVTGKGVTNYMQLNAISRCISFDIQG